MPDRAGERADAIPEAAISAAVNVLLADSGLPQYGGHRATVERRQRLAFDAAAPFLRAAQPEAGSEEGEADAIRIREALAWRDRAENERDEARAEIKRLREWIATEGRNCPSNTTVDAALRAAHPEADRALEDEQCGAVHDKAKAVCTLRRGHSGDHANAQGYWMPREGKR